MSKEILALGYVSMLLGITYIQYKDMDRPWWFVIFLFLPAMTVFFK